MDKADQLTLEAQLLLAKSLDVPVEALGTTASMFNLHEWDSLGHIRIILEIEKRLDRELTTEQILSLEDIQDVARLLCDKSSESDQKGLPHD